ncbi:leucine-rich repeat flightless-interacting protein 2 isoform X2 [Amblyomma americanum]
MATGGRRSRGPTRLYSTAEDLDHIAREAEARLAQRRQARAEARAIRLRELEKQARENDEQLDRHCDSGPEPVRPMRVSREGRPFTSGSSFSGSRRSSEDSTDGLDGRDFRHQLQDVEESFRKAMISNAQLDNERTALAYHVDTLKDDMEELTEKFLHVQKDHRDKSRALDQLQRDLRKLQEENTFLQEGIRQRDELIEANGLVLVLNGDGPDLVTQEAAQLLDQAGHGSLDVRLKRFAEEKQQLQDEINRLQLDLAEERQKVTRLEQISLVHGPQTNGPEMRLIEVQREANKQVDDYKYRLRKAEQENIALQSSVSRLETQVSRFKTTLEESEKLEDDLKAEKRKLQRECREAQARIEELETANKHLQKRIDKLKSARNSLK